MSRFDGMSMYDDVKVSLSLGDLSAIHSAANCFEFANEKREALKKKNAELVKECETQAMEIGQLCVRIMEAERELAAWKQAANADKPEADALAYLEERNTPFESKDVDTACEVILALLVERKEAQKPREVSPLLKQRIENAADVLRLEVVPAYNDGTYPDVAGDRFNTVYKALRELHDTVKAEVL